MILITAVLIFVLALIGWMIAGLVGALLSWVFACALLLVAGVVATALD